MRDVVGRIFVLKEMLRRRNSYKGECFRYTKYKVCVVKGIEKFIIVFGNFNIFYLVIDIRIK